MLFSPALVNAVLDKADGDMLDALAKELFPDVYSGGASNLVVYWVHEGDSFKVDEYDGSESLTFRDSGGWITA